MKRKFFTFLTLTVAMAMFTSCESGGNNDPVDPPALSETVTIAGVKWTTGNLTANKDASSGHKVESSPAQYGSFFKWGSKCTYDKSNFGEGWGNKTTGAAMNPTSSSTDGFGYDYIGMSGGTAHPGDPCQSLGAAYKTPTQAQWRALVDNSSTWGSYKGIKGRFFGFNSASCTNATIADGCIFLPAAGYRGWHDGFSHNKDSDGYYWASSVYDSEQGQNCNFDKTHIDTNRNYRGFVFSVRCIKE